MTDVVLSPPAVATASARQLLVDWANEQDGWVRSAVTEVLASRQPLGSEQLDALYAQFLVEKGLADGEAVEVPHLLFQESVASEAADFIIEQLDGVQGVNALAAGQTIAFNPGLTILFGENGSGKTGYTRILKQLAAVRTAEPILPDVNAIGTAPTPQATITYRLGTASTQLNWTGQSGVSPFTYLSVFDSPAVHLHVDDDLTYVYTPTDLALFPLVNKAICGVRDRLDAAMRAAQPGTSPFLAQFTRGTPVYQAIETLSAATELTALNSLAAVTDDEAATLTTLQASVGALQSDTVRAQLAVARARRDCYKQLAELITSLDDFADASYVQAVTNAAAARQDVERLRSELYAAAGLSGEADSVWQGFILGGEAYREHIGAHDYPQDGDRCLYCLQPLEPVAAALLRRYRDFANDTAQARISDADRAADTASEALRRLPVASLQQSIVGQQDEERPDAVLVAAHALVDAAAKLQSDLTSRTPVQITELRTQARKIVASIGTRHQAAIDLITELSAKSEEREGALRQAQTDLARLKDRLELQARLPAVTKHVEDAKWAQRATQLAKRVPQVLKSLTEVSKVASEQLLNTDFAQRFNAECAALRAPSVGLAFPGRQGQAARRKTVSALHRPSEVLSEGEQKVIALADFLAEAGLRLTPAPLVFDDPVNSLDYRRIREVADRVRDLAVDRQVIVFTHNIWFATELLSRFESNQAHCTYYDVNDEPAKGTIVPGSHPRWDTVKKTTGKINELIQAAKAQQGETREALIERAYSRIRTWCEVVVESELLAGVTQRHQPNVMMTALPNIKVAGLSAATTAILPIFKKACRVIDAHSQPLETLSVRPNLAELERDWADLQAALKAYREAA